MKKAPTHFRPFSRLAQRLRKDDGGVTAVEFAFISIPFFTLIFGMVEVCTMFIANTVLDHAASEASRSIRTGKVQSSADPETEFRNLVCGELAALVKCDTGLTIDVKTFSDFQSVANPSPIDPITGTVTPPTAFNGGTGGEIVVVRVFYEWTLFTPIITAPLANLGTDKRLLQATVAFRNEPF